MKSFVLVELYIFPVVYQFLVSLTPIVHQVLNQFKSDGSASFPSVGSSHCRAASKSHYKKLDRVGNLPFIKFNEGKNS